MNKIILLLKSLPKRKGAMKFLVVGSVNTGVDFVLFFIFANLLYLYPPAANLLSTGLTLILSFFLNYHFVFQSQKNKWSVAVKFVLITLFNVWIIQTGIIYLLTHSFTDSQFYADHVWTSNLLIKIAAVCVSLVLNFIGYKTIFTGENTRDKKV